MCNTSRKRFAEIDKPPDPGLNLKMYDTCMKSNHPSIYFCKNEPETDNARELHHTLKKEVRKIEKREKRKKEKRRRRKKGRNKKNKKKRKNEKKSKRKNRRNRRKKSKDRKERVHRSKPSSMHFV